jgi:membrane fusion protein (multidrug efflux system)
MPADATIVSLRSDPAEAPAARHDVPRKQPQQPPREQPKPPPREQPERPIERSSEPEKAPQSPRRRWLRWALFALLPLVLIAGGYWYVTGGRVMSTDNAYVESDKVGISRRSTSGTTNTSKMAKFCSAWTISRSGSQ